MSALKEFEKKFRVTQLTVNESSNWLLSVRPVQQTLGSLVLSSRHECTSFSDLELSAQAELGSLFSFSDQLLKDAFSPNKINFICLMLQDPLLHFHVIPRYSAPLNFDGKDWVDTDWPKPPILHATVADTDVLLSIRDYLISKR